ncbi:MAG: uroporphyrinogen-III synthase [Casimicrobiaceae bacterium]
MEIHPLVPPREPPGPLAGAGILVTRPARQAAGLVRRLAALGATPIAWPAIVILPPADPAPLAHVQANLAAYDLAVFVSANAVEFGVGDPARWPPSLVPFVPGPGTAEALAAVGVADVRMPAERFDSEGLLALPELQDVHGKRVIVFRGDGGRDVLGDALRARGARVDYVACYRRAAPQSDAGGLRAVLCEGRLHAVTVTSSEGLDNLLAALGDAGRATLARVPVFAAHPRIAEHARARGLTAIATAGSDAGLVAGLLKWFAAASTAKAG